MLIVSRNLEKANENDGFKMTALENTFMELCTHVLSIHGSLAHAIALLRLDCSVNEVVLWYCSNENDGFKMTALENTFMELCTHVLSIHGSLAHAIALLRLDCSVDEVVLWYCSKAKNHSSWPPAAMAVQYT